MKRRIKKTVANALVLTGAIGVFTAMAASSAFGQSPMFPNVRPVQQNPTRFFLPNPYGPFDPMTPVYDTRRFPPNLRPKRLPNREVYGPGAYPHISGYGSSPYVRVYGGAGSSYPTEP